MKYQSVSTEIADPYRAGGEIGERLADMAPEVVLVFCSIHYADAIPDLVAGLRDALGDQALICGGTGDGFFETDGVASHGVSALGIHSEGQARWKVAMARGVKADSAKAAEEACFRAREALEKPVTLAFVMADGVKADGCRLVEGMRRAMPAPFFGALAADDRQLTRSMVFAGDQAAEDAVIVLAASGHVPFRINAASGWRPVGDAGRVTRVEGPVVHEIDDRPAEQFFREQTGKTLGGMTLSVLPLAEFTSPDESQFVLRSRSGYRPDGSVKFFGRVSLGARVKVCHASLDEILGGVDAALNGLREEGFVPAAVIVISCAGRRWLLPESGREELERTIRAMGPLPLIGLSSFGEISPFRYKPGNYSAVMFHNVTFAAAVLGR